jgi:hypothetical protein
MRAIVDRINQNAHEAYYTVCGEFFYDGDSTP